MSVARLVSLVTLPLMAACASAPSTPTPVAAFGTAACEGAPATAARLGALQVGDSLYAPGRLARDEGQRADLDAMFRPDQIADGKPVQVTAIDIGTPDNLELAVLVAGPGDKFVVQVLVCDPGRGWQSTADSGITAEGHAMIVDADAVTTSDRKRRTALRLRQSGGVGLEFYEPVYLIGGDPLATPVGEGGRQVLDESQDGEAYVRTDAIDASGWYPDGISEAFFVLRVFTDEAEPDQHLLSADVVVRSDGSPATVGEAWFLLGRGANPAACASSTVRCAPRGDVSKSDAWPFDWIAGAWPSRKDAQVGAKALGVDAASALWLLSTSERDPEDEDWPTAPNGARGLNVQPVGAP